MFYQPLVQKVVLAGVLNHHQFAVLVAILAHMNPEKGSFPSHNTLGKSLGLSPKSVQRYAKQLVDKELLEAYPRKRHATVYRLSHLSREWNKANQRTKTKSSEDKTIVTEDVRCPA